MTLIKSISGIRGTIGGTPGQALTPVDIVSLTYAYAACLRARRPKPTGSRYTVVVGKDGRISGSMVEGLVVSTLVASGVDVIKAGYASTPTTEMGVILSGADGGIILTASHNPRQWNALKLLDKVLDLPAVDAEAVRASGFTVVLDPINSVGALIMPRLLERLGVRCIMINDQVNGEFEHNPEPLPKNLTELSETVVRHGADLGISVDPDVDRLAFICEDGTPFVEENTLVAVADYLFERAALVAKANGQTLAEVTAPYAPVSVSNLSSSRALRDVTEKWGGTYYASAVGEVNVTTLMHEKNALIGGEGNGGVIYPAIHSGRDAMVGVALFLSYMAAKKMKASAIGSALPQYSIAKNRIEISDKSLIDKILADMKKRFAGENITDIDGVKISFESKKEWVHLRRSNTEPIIRIYSEAPTAERAQALGEEVMAEAEKIIAENS